MKNEYINKNRANLWITTKDEDFYRMMDNGMKR